MNNFIELLRDILPIIELIILIDAIQKISFILKDVETIKNKLDN